MTNPVLSASSDKANPGICEMKINFNLLRLPTKQLSAFLEWISSANEPELPVFFVGLRKSLVAEMEFRSRPKADPAEMEAHRSITVTTEGLDPMAICGAQRFLMGTVATLEFERLRPGRLSALDSACELVFALLEALATAGRKYHSGC